MERARGLRDLGSVVDPTARCVSEHTSALCIELPVTCVACTTPGLTSGSTGDSHTTPSRRWIWISRSPRFGIEQCAPGSGTVSQPGGPVTPILSLLALGTGTAAAGKIDLDIACAGTYTVGDTVPYTLTLDEQAGIDHLIDVTVTLDTPVAQRTILTKTIFLFANQLVSLTLPLKRNLSANVLPGTYLATLTVVENGKAITDTCTFDVL
jgi:hypothetical protein